MPHCPKVACLEIDDHPFEATKAGDFCELCSALDSNLDQVIVDDRGLAGVCSDSESYSGRQAGGHRGRVSPEAAT